MEMRNENKIPLIRCFFSQRIFSSSFLSYAVQKNSTQVVVSGIFLPVPYSGFKQIRAGLLSDTYLEAQVRGRELKPFCFLSFFFLSFFLFLIFLFLLFVLVLVPLVPLLSFSLSFSPSLFLFLTRPFPHMPPTLSDHRKGKARTHRARSDGRHSRGD